MAKQKGHGGKKPIYQQKDIVWYNANFSVLRMHEF